MPLWSPSASPDGKVSRATGGRVRVLTGDDTRALHKLLDADPVGNTSVAAALQQRGTAAVGKGRQSALLLGIDAAEPHSGADRRLISACWLGSNIIPVGADPTTAKQFGRAARALRRRVSSIYGRSEAVLALFEATGWSNHREVRAHQPLMVMYQEPEMRPLPGVRPSKPEEFSAVEQACAAMFTEELGFSPYDHGASQYRDRIRGLIQAGHSLIAVDPESRQITFKAEFGSVTEQAVQVQGVWVNPLWRGRGMAAPGMAAVVNYGLRLAPRVSLYVNGYNTPAIRAYERVGFQHAGAYSTVLF
ncbi:DUF4081 domain-containing GNAT family N-acetyltransferase [Nesterenkonia salmonea]|uniref:GNAT family N-acetyltransferase n=1 Tax=Nesterenkonia salmonea TaxID=1804987 RepID=UPI001FB80FC9|nr:DUF4081 domain-containing GNAT family N-acetyltransferase [Nesterenkonia salmonea]